MDDTWTVGKIGNAKIEPQTVLKRGKIARIGPVVQIDRTSEPHVGNVIENFQNRFK